jgi:hypothetical protein
VNHYTHFSRSGPQKCRQYFLAVEHRGLKTHSENKPSSGIFPENARLSASGNPRRPFGPGASGATTSRIFDRIAGNGRRLFAVGRISGGVREMFWREGGWV